MDVAAVQYAPQNWYWFIGADTNNVWSSARATLVPTSDQAYTDWTNASPGNLARSVATMADVENILRGTYPPGTPKTYAADVRYRKASGGVIIQSLSPALFLTDAVSRNTMGSALSYAKDNPGATMHWKMSDGTFITVVEADLLKMVNTTAGFVQSCFTCEGDMVAGIDGSTITTLAQIDAAFAAISNVFA